MTAESSPKNVLSRLGSRIIQKYHYFIMDAFIKNQDLRIPSINVGCDRDRGVHLIFVETRYIASLHWGRMYRNRHAYIFEMHPDRALHKRVFVG